jgi:hypothetical protein
MIRICVCAVLVMAGDHPGDTQQRHQDLYAETDSQASRPFHEILADMRTSLRHEVAATDAGDWAATVVQLTEIYAEIMRDDRLPTSGTLQGYRVKLRSRLLKIQKQLERDMKRAAKKTKSPADAADEAYHRLAGEQLAMLLSLSGDSLGGPATVYKYGGLGVLGAGGGAARADYGTTLVELIRRTISPEFWDVNGGPGVIVYYPAWHALVVRATAEVHGQIGGVIGGLRK